MRAFMLARLPLAWFAGLRVEHLDDNRCAVSVPRGWRTQNPFRSTYFAALTMAAELSTGAPAMVAVQAAGVRISMLVTDVHGSFGKKATGRVVFRYEGVQAMSRVVQQAVESGEGVTVDAETVGRMADGTEVARFTFTWSFKKKAIRPQT
jgi:outer membrane receptor protein involved in Fe transport